jgi:DNA-binding PucR family transcriptional regulator
LVSMLDDLRLLIDVGRGAGRSGEVQVEDFLPELLLARSPHLAALLEEAVFGPLEAGGDRRGADLVATLEAFHDTALDRRAAAAKLHVHPNTLDYRLRRLEELTGLRLTDPGDMTVMALAIRYRRMVRRTPILAPDAPDL